MDLPSPITVAMVSILTAATTIIGLVVRWLMRERDHMARKVEDCTEAHIKVAVLEKQMGELAKLPITADVYADQYGRAILDVNEGFTTLFGWAKEEILGRPVEHIMSSESIQRHKRAIERKRLAIEAGDTDVAMVHVNGGVGQDKSGRQFAVTVEVAPCVFEGQPAFHAHIRKAGR